ncbi:alpha/beta fold hydrolase [Sphingosinithalassobacter portus]|uniref:alpha/beta fold hydrolase n=1 Tax=Stakelama portus TaxID=2676234 RepID=UPI000D6E6CA2|nr:alpha/beta hydrolase [Sphingosinithalassobacter portus]
MTDLVRRSHTGSSGYEISFAVAGPETGPVCVFLHGSGPGASGLSNFRGNYAAFVAAGYRVFLPDLVGYGESEKPEGIDYTLQLFTDTIYEMLAAQGVDNIVLVGNSLGGAIAIQLTLDHPEFVRGLILMAPGSIEELPVYFQMPGIALMGQAFISEEFTIESQRAVVTALVHPDFRDQISDELIAERFAVARKQPKDVLMRMRTLNLGPRLGEIEQPIFVMWGEEDKFCPSSGVEHFFTAGCNVRAIRFAKVGHWCQVERRDEFNAYAVAFLNGLG